MMSGDIPCSRGQRSLKGSGFGLHQHRFTEAAKPLFGKVPGTSYSSTSISIRKSRLNRSC